jgi:hypothetical protein
LTYQKPVVHDFGSIADHTCTDGLFQIFSGNSGYVGDTDD